MSDFQSALKKALGLPEKASNAQILWKLEDRLGAQAPADATHGSHVSPKIQASDDPQERFHQLAKMTSDVLGISLSDAYSRVSRENPLMWEQSMKAANI